MSQVISQSNDGSGSKAPAQSFRERTLKTGAPSTFSSNRYGPTRTRSEHLLSFATPPDSCSAPALPGWPAPRRFSPPGRAPVSYTHLRAHETRHDLVCRLLLEKKKIRTHR